MTRFISAWHDRSFWDMPVMIRSIVSPHWVEWYERFVLGSVPGPALRTDAKYRMSELRFTREQAVALISELQEAVSAHDAFDYSLTGYYYGGRDVYLSANPPKESV